MGTIAEPDRRKKAKEELNELKERHVTSGGNIYRDQGVLVNIAWSAPSMNFACPTCAQQMQCPDHFAGRKASCPKCGQKVLIPTPPKPIPVPTNKTTLGKLDEGANSADAIPIMPTAIMAPPLALPPPLPSLHEEDHGSDQSDRQSITDEIASKLRGVLLLLAKDWRRLPTCPHLWFCFCLFFLPWVNLSCDGRPIASQSGLQACYGGITLDQKLERIAKMERERNPQVKNREGGPFSEWSAISCMYAFCILMGGFCGLICIVAMILKVPFATVAAHIASLGFGALAFLTILAQMIVGFPIERKIEKNFEKNRVQARRMNEDFGIRPDPRNELGEVIGAGMMDVNYSFWLWVSAILTFISIPALVLEITILGCRLTNQRAFQQHETG